MSSAYKNDLKQRLRMNYPRPDFSSLTNTSLLRMVNREGDSSPPCLTPDKSSNMDDKLSTHSTRSKTLEYQQFSKFINTMDNYC